MTNSIAVLMTCHNRRDVTISCLQKLFECQPNLDVFCVDDNSTDGSYAAIQKQFPQVHLYHGNGNLFWCRGMGKAWKEARKNREYDYYIWLNDDLNLYQNAFDEILECSHRYNDMAIVSGLVQEELSGEPIYGGYDDNKRLITANGKNNDIYRLNGNFVIIPRYVFNKVGFFDEIYHHDIGDVDYGLVARKLGIPVISTRCYIGSTKGSLKSNFLRIRKNGVGLCERFRKLYSPLGAPPTIHYHFIKKHHGRLQAMGYYVYLHFINLMPDSLWDFFYNEKKNK